MTKEAQQNNTTPSRKKFLVWGAAILGSIGVLKYFNRKPEVPVKNTIKMLAQDGTLVEVDASKIYCGNRKKVSDEELKTWVTKK